METHFYFEVRLKVKVMSAAVRPNIFSSFTDIQPVVVFVKKLAFFPYYMGDHSNLIVTKLITRKLLVKPFSVIHFT